MLSTFLKPFNKKDRFNKKKLKKKKNKYFTFICSIISVKPIFKFSSIKFKIDGTECIISNDSQFSITSLQKKKEIKFFLKLIHHLLNGLSEKSPIQLPILPA
jgi:hypothetical protein